MNTAHYLPQVFLRGFWLAPQNDTPKFMIVSDAKKDTLLRQGWKTENFLYGKLL